MENLGEFKLSKLEFNNFILKFREQVERGVLFVVRKLTKLSSQLKLKKTKSEVEKQKNDIKAEHYLEQIKALNSFHDHDIGKFLVLFKKSHEGVFKDSKSTVEERALCRVFNVKTVKNFVEEFRKQYPNWAIEVPNIIKSLGVNYRAERLKRLEANGRLNAVLSREKKVFILLHKIVGLDVDPKMVEQYQTTLKKRKSNKESQDEGVANKESKINPKEIEIIESDLENGKNELPEKVHHEQKKTDLQLQQNVKMKKKNKKLKSNSKVDLIPNPNDIVSSLYQNSNFDLNINVEFPEIALVNATSISETEAKNIEPENKKKRKYLQLLSNSNFSNNIGSNFSLMEVSNHQEKQIDNYDTNENVISKTVTKIKSKSTSEIKRIDLSKTDKIEIDKNGKEVSDSEDEEYLKKSNIKRWKVNKTLFSRESEDEENSDEESEEDSACAVRRINKRKVDDKSEDEYNDCDLFRVKRGNKFFRGDGGQRGRERSGWRGNRRGQLRGFKGRGAEKGRERYRSNSGGERRGFRSGERRGGYRGIGREFEDSDPKGESQVRGRGFEVGDQWGKSRGRGRGFGDRRDERGSIGFGGRGKGKGGESNNQFVGGSRKDVEQIGRRGGSQSRGDKRRRGCGDRKSRNRKSGSSNSNYMPLGDKNSQSSAGNSGSSLLHPSWLAKKKEKEISGLTSFKGKVTKFDD